MNLNKTLLPQHCLGLLLTPGDVADVKRIFDKQKIYMGSMDMGINE
jgi:hypothetical protein